MLLISFKGKSQNRIQVNTQKSLTESYIFNSENLEGNLADLSAIYSSMGKYYEAVEMAKVPLLEEVFHEQWFMRDTDTPDEATLNVEPKSKFIKRVQDHGPYPGYASKRVFATIGMANDNLAFVRINKAPTRSATSFFLYKLEGDWMIMDKIWAHVRDESTSVHQSETYTTIDSLLHDYFNALSQSDIATVTNLLHHQWDLKQVNGEGILKVISKVEFINLLKVRNEYVDFNQLLSIEVYHDNLAVARIDIPSQNTTTFLTLFEIAGEWKIVSERRTVGS